eukprot:TRINITY_DN3227_c0_g1_i1.p1 TRINITY_DN3227_c0_g1~~TRINITY_DN3227_c0_g1_i1.p1  ORF type:complete len:238 (+),score=35.40 TRINITY_DN3227_c0_g1_i1:569-1282(+)
MYLEKLNCIYDDFKEANILLARDGHLRFTHHYEPTSLTCTERQYQAPELRTVSTTPISHDNALTGIWWSLGIFLLRCSLEKEEWRRALESRRERDSVPEISSLVGATMRDFVQQCLCSDPFLRMNTHRALLHPFFGGVKFPPLLSATGTLPPSIISPLAQSDSERNRFQAYFQKTAFSAAPVDTLLAPDLGDQLVGKSVIGEATINASTTGGLFAYVPTLSSTSSPPSESPLHKRNQ